jgi:DNA polymerase-3 subunit epsilon
MIKEFLPSTPLAEVVFCFLDVETTGLHPQFGDRICEIALLRWVNGRTLERFQSLVNPGRPISPGAFAVNGISEAMVRDAPRFGELASRILSFLENAVIVAHNAPFDLGFLTAQLVDLRLPPPPNPVVCTLALARRCFQFPGYSLGVIARHLGIAVTQEHRAMADVELTREMFFLFMQHFQQQGITSLGELLALQGGSIPLPAPEAVILPPALDEALRRRSLLKLRYVSSRWTETQRIVEPIEVAAYGDYTYLVAFCHLRQEQRTFRLDRIVEMNLVEGGRKL